jgi:chorismate mutase/prephenate dehydratase
MNMDITDYEAQIDKVDAEMLRLFKERMEISGRIALYKRERGIPVSDAARERGKLGAMGEKAGEDYRSYSYMLYSMLFEISRAHQGSVLNAGSGIGGEIGEALNNTAPMFPRHATVACQGVEGAYSQIACDRLFTEPGIMYFTSFDTVFSAVRDDMCEYGVLPLENSTAGSVNAIYDLMMRYSFKIVRSVRVKIDHNLLAKPGTRIGGVREIISHEQAIQQCAEYLRRFGRDVKITAVANTAIAAKMAADPGRDGAAALASRECCGLYGLDCLEGSVQDRGNNYTRFICISKNLKIFPGADRTSIMLTTDHKPGALYRVLGRIAALGVNIVKLESRPIPDRDFEFMFYFDLEVSVYSDKFIRLIAELDGMCEEFHYLGSYMEKI